MPIAKRHAEVTWEGGNLAKGKGTLQSGSGALNQLPLTWASRAESPDGKTSPEELIAAAHAGCYAMALTLTLGENNTPAEQLKVSATCTLDQLPTGPKITQEVLDVQGRVPKLTDQQFEELAKRAEQLCPVSNALRNNVEIQLRTKLEA